MNSTKVLWFDAPDAVIPQTQLDEAVEFINRRTILSGLDLAREVGAYILDHFFDGDYQSFADPSSAKEKSFRALLARKDLLLGRMTVYSFVRISHQLELLPSDVVERLTLTHHRVLLTLPDPQKKEELAHRALEEGWTSQVLAAEVRKLLPRSRRGRKPSPPFVKTIRRLAKAVEPRAPKTSTRRRSAVWVRGRPRTGPPSSRSTSHVWRPSKKPSTRRRQSSGPSCRPKSRSAIRCVFCPLIRWSWRWKGS